MSRSLKGYREPGRVVSWGSRSFTKHRMDQWSRSPAQASRACKPPWKRTWWLPRSWIMLDALRGATTGRRRCRATSWLNVWNRCGQCMTWKNWGSPPTGVTSLWFHPWLCKMCTDKVDRCQKIASPPQCKYVLLHNWSFHFPGSYPCEQQLFFGFGRPQISVWIDCDYPSSIFIIMHVHFTIVIMKQFSINRN